MGVVEAWRKRFDPDVDTVIAKGRESSGAHAQEADGIRECVAAWEQHDKGVFTIRGDGLSRVKQITEHCANLDAASASTER